MPMRAPQYFTISSSTGAPDPPSHLDRVAKAQVDLGSDIISPGAPTYSRSRFLCALLTTCHSDWLVGNATQQSSLIPTANLTNGTTYSGQTTYNGYVYQTDVQYVSGYLQNTSLGINHNLSVGADGLNAVDGLVAMMNVKILTNPDGAKSKSSCVFSRVCETYQLIRLSLPRFFLFSPQSNADHAGSDSLPYIRCTHLDALCCIILTLITLAPSFCLEASHGHAQDVL
jgi:hypothetical protein